MRNNYKLIIIIIFLILNIFACKSVVIVKNPVFQFNQIYKDSANSIWKQGETITIGVGESIQLGIKNINKNLLVNPSWTVNNNAIGEIDKNGVFTPKQQGVTIVTANFVDYIVKTYYITISDNKLSSSASSGIFPLPIPTPTHIVANYPSVSESGQSSSPTPKPTGNISITIVSPSNNATISGTIMLKARVNGISNNNVEFYYKIFETGASTLINETFIPTEQNECSIQWNTNTVTNRDYYLGAKIGEITSPLVKVTVYNSNDEINPCNQTQITSTKNPVEGGGHSTVVSIIKPPGCNSTVDNWEVKYNGVNIGTLDTNTGDVAVWTAPTDADANANFGITVPYTITITATINGVKAEKNIDVNYGSVVVCPGAPAPPCGGQF